MPRANYVRVHETVDGYKTAFNLDDFSQFTRYANSVAATNCATHYRVPDIISQHQGEGKVHEVQLQPKDRSQHMPIFLTAQLERRHPASCVYCEQRFDAHAGNGTSAK